MATRTWNSGASTDMNDGNNYTPTGAIATGDDLVFDATSAVNATATAALDVQSINTTGYTGNWDNADYDVTASGAILFNHTGTLDCTNCTLTIDVDADFTIGANMSTADMTGCDYDLKGTGNYSINQSLVSSGYPNDITCAYNGKTTTFIGNQHTAMGGILTTASGGTFSLTGKNLSLYKAGTVTPWVRNGATFNGSGEVLSFSPLSASTITLPSGDMGNAVFELEPGTNDAVTYNMSGSITNCNIFRTSNSNLSQTGTYIFNTNNHDISTGEISFNQNIAAVTSTFTQNFGSSTITATGIFNSTIDSGATCILNMSTSTWSVGGNVTFDADVTLNAGTSSFTMTGSGTTITSNGATFYTIKFDSDGNTINAADSISCTERLIEPGTTLSVAAGASITYTSYTSGDIDGTGAKNVVLVSATPSTAYNEVNPASMIVSNVNVTDSNATNEIDAADGTNTDGGGNTNWTFIVAPAAVADSTGKRYIQRYVGRVIGRSIARNI